MRRRVRGWTRLRRDVQAVVARLPLRRRPERISAVDLADLQVLMQRRAALLAHLGARYELHDGDSIHPRDGTIVRGQQP